MHELNLELLEQLSVTCDWLLEKHISLPNESTFCSLLIRAKTLLSEIQADESKILQYRTISNRRNVTDFKTDDKEPVPADSIYKGGIDKKSQQSTKPPNSKKTRSAAKKHIQ
jgi:hypothetical protein